MIRVDRILIGQVHDDGRRLMELQAGDGFVNPGRICESGEIENASVATWA